MKTHKKIYTVEVTVIADGYCKTFYSEHDDIIAAVNKDREVARNVIHAMESMGVVYTLWSTIGYKL